MEIVIALAVKFWQWSLLIALVIIGFVINLFDRKKPKCYTFKYNEMPQLKPLPIKTKGKGFFKAIAMWLLATRNWELVQDWRYNIDGVEYVIPKGFQFDGASIPKFLRTFFSPVGVLLIGGLVHDYMYKYTACKPVNKKDALLVVDQK